LENIGIEEPLSLVSTMSIPELGLNHSMLIKSDDGSDNKVLTTALRKQL
jgi:hypothetical protein